MKDLKFGSYLESAVEKRSIEDIRGALKGIIDADPAFLTGRFDEALRYLHDRGLDVYEPDNPEFPMRESGWDKAYFSLVLTHLSYNFSAARIAHLRAVGAQVMADDPVYRPQETAAPITEPAAIPKSQASTGKRRRFPAVPVLAVLITLLALILLRILLN